jgi:DNA polymerase I-like protein with 3'-5' exonuclease and polymerase domains
LPRKPTKISESVSISIKDSFITRNSGYFISADYSQIEIRIMSFLSNDSSLIEIFKQNEINDVYILLASRIFKIPLESITEEQRGHAKTICLAILYGLVS